MRRLIRLLALLSLTLLAACTGVPPAGPGSATPAPTSTPEPFTLRIVHTNDTWGYLHPCG